MQINILVLIGICLATMFFGYFFGLVEGRGQGYKKRKKEEAEEKRMQPIIPAPPAKDNSLLKLGLDDMNQTRLEMDGQRVEAAQLTSEQRKRLIDLMVMMRPWIDTNTSKPPAPVTAPSSQIAPKPIVSAPVSVPKEEPAAPNSMVAQIDAVLQTHLANSPLAGKGIRLVEAPNGSVIVMVGMKKYDSVGNVPDPQVQAVIRAAIAEWEKKYTPGG